PLGCNFCSTSAMFGGKGKFINFYSTGDELFDVMCEFERTLKVNSFFVMDENFLLHRKRALRLLELMEKHDKAWALYVFSSANVLRTYTIDQLIRLGVAWVWMGLEGENSQYTKLYDVDTHAMVRELQSHGTRVLGSTIIGLEDHTPENIDRVIDHAVSYNTVFHQFMLYTPIPGTPLHAELTAKGVMKDESEFDPADIHGQAILNYRHPHLTDEDTAELMVRAFDRDFAVNGPSVVRIVETTLAGWKRYKNHPDARIRRRFVQEVAAYPTTYSALVGAAKHYYRKNPVMRAKMSAILKDLYSEFGWKARFYGEVGGRVARFTIRREERRLAAGWTYEPPTYYEKNAAWTAPSKATLCQYATPGAVQSEPTPAPHIAAPEMASVES
ncbi:MAG: B12-binding domain-containing radical SAM protein, partial [bacterium]|nr:B12-binding domain-containing radical SAM protein [bacterium]